MLLLLPYTEYLGRLGEPRNIADVILVFLLVYAVLKLVRGTRAAPMAAAIGAFCPPLLARRQTRSGNPRICFARRS